MDQRWVRLKHLHLEVHMKIQQEGRIQHALFLGGTSMIFGIFTRMFGEMIQFDESTTKKKWKVIGL